MRFMQYFCGTGILVSAVFSEFGAFAGSLTAGALVAFVGVSK